MVDCTQFKSPQIYVAFKNGLKWFSDRWLNVKVTLIHQAFNYKMSGFVVLYVKGPMRGLSK